MTLYKKTWVIGIITAIQGILLITAAVLVGGDLLIALLVSCFFLTMIFNCIVGMGLRCPRCNNLITFNPATGYRTTPSRICRKCNLPLDRKVSEEEIKQPY